MTVEVLNGELSEEEIARYTAYIKEKYKENAIDKIRLTIDGEFVNIHTFLKSIGFQRIRRITGYLVGTLDRFNNGKKAEVADRVHHGYDDDYYHTYSGLLEE